MWFFIAWNINVYCFLYSKNGKRRIGSKKWREMKEKRSHWQKKRVLPYYIFHSRSYFHSHSRSLRIHPFTSSTIHISMSRYLFTSKANRKKRKIYFKMIFVLVSCSSVKQFEARSSQFAIHVKKFFVRNSIFFTLLVFSLFIIAIFVSLECYHLLSIEIHAFVYLTLNVYESRTNSHDDDSIILYFHLIRSNNKFYSILIELHLKVAKWFPIRERLHDL